MDLNSAIEDISSYTYNTTFSTSDITFNISTNNGSQHILSTTLKPTNLRTTSKSASEDDISMESVYIVGATVCAAGLLANILMLLLVCALQRKKPWKKQTTLLLNICACDLVICSAGLAYFILVLIEENIMTSASDPLGRIVRGVRLHCAKRAAMRVWDIGGFANMFGLLLMSVDGFVVVKFSLKHQLILNPLRIKVCLIACWVLALLLGLLELYFIVGYEHDLIKPPFPFKTTNYCSREYFFYAKIADLGQEKATLVAHAFGATIIGVVFITLSVVYIYIAVIVIRVHRARRERKASQLKASKPRGRHANEYKGVITTVILLVSFLILWLPLQFFFLLNLLGVKEPATGNRQTFLLHLLLIVCSFTGVVDVAINSFRTRLMGYVLESCRRRLRLGSKYRKTSRDGNSSYLTTTASTNRTNTTTSNVADSSE